METIQEVSSIAYNYFTPEPLSPLFKPGGVFYGLNEDLTFTAITFVFLIIIDNLIAKPFIKPKVRYFFLHAIANAVVVAAAAQDVYKSFTSHPYDVLSGPCYSAVGNCAAIALHAYHIVFFKLNAADWEHHLQFVPMCFIGAAYKQNSGALVSMSSFYISGLPGGIEYVFLVLVEHGLMKKMSEKRYFALINQWIRGPGAVMTAVVGLFAWREGVVHMHWAVAMTLASLHFYNGMYFCQIAVESCARFEYKLKNKMIDENGKPVGTDSRKSTEEVESPKLI